MYNINSSEELNNEVTYQVIRVDNYNRDNIPDYVLATGIKRRCDADLIVEALNAEITQHDADYYKVFDSSYVPKTGEY